MSKIAPASTEMESKPKKTSKETAKKEYVSCDFCKKVVTPRCLTPHIKTHLIKYADTVVNCLRCKKVFKSKEYLKLHMEKKHKPAKTPKTKKIKKKAGKVKMKSPKRELKIRVPATAIKDDDTEIHLESEIEIAETVKTESDCLYAVKYEK